MGTQLVDMINKRKKKVLNQTPRVSEVVEVLLNIMKDHVGEQNKISFLELFKKIYGVDYDGTELEHWFAKDVLQKATHYCRKATKCQIISQGTNKESRRAYWVASTMSDAMIYKDTLEKQVVAMRNAEKRMEGSIRNRWYARTNEWVIRQRIREDNEVI